MKLFLKRQQTPSSRRFPFHLRFPLLVVAQHINMTVSSNSSFKTVVCCAVSSSPHSTPSALYALRSRAPLALSDQHRLLRGPLTWLRTPFLWRSYLTALFLAILRRYFGAQKWKIALLPRFEPYKNKARKGRNSV